MRTHTIHIDDFHFEKAKRYAGKGTPGKLYYYKIFNFTRFTQEIWLPLLKNGILHKKLTLLDLKQDKYCLEKVFNIKFGDIVIFEGVFLFKEEFLPHFDLKMFLEVKKEEIMRRVVIRDTHISKNDPQKIFERYSQKYFAGQTIYLEKNNFWPKIDVIIDNNDFHDPKITKMA